MRSGFERFLIWVERFKGLALFLYVIVFGGYAMIIMASDPFGRLLAGEDIWHAASEIGVVLACLYVGVNSGVTLLGGSDLFAFIHNAVIMFVTAGLMLAQSGLYLHSRFLDGSAALIAVWGILAAILAILCYRKLQAFAKWEEKEPLQLAYGVLFLKPTFGLSLILWGYMAALNLGYGFRHFAGPDLSLLENLLVLAQVGFSVLMLATSFLAQFSSWAKIQFAAISLFGLLVSAVTIGLWLKMWGATMAPISVEFVLLSVATFSAILAIQLTAPPEKNLGGRKRR